MQSGRPDTPSGRADLGPGTAPGAVPGTAPTRPGAAPEGPGPFIAFIESERPGGLVAHWDSRRRRKHAEPGGPPGGTWWAPGARGWWIGILFAVGSALFALGALPSYPDAVGTRVDAVTFFIGSLFFTTAAFLQYRESVDAANGGPARGWRRVFASHPGRIDWWATGIQLVGTLYFNISTGNAARVELTAQATYHHVWRPDALGSTCFLVASGLAWFEVCHGWFAWSPGRLAWWITFLNLMGSIAFGGSAVASYVVPATGQIRNAELSNLGTLIGGLCFLAGAILLLPERTEGSPEP